MSTVDRNWLLLGQCLLALVFIAATFAGVGEATGSRLIILPMIIVIELIVYFIAAMVTNARATIGMAAGTAVVLMMLRGVCALAGGILFNLFSGPGVDVDFFQAWGHPVVVILQIVLLIFSGPYLMAVLIPDLVGDQQAAKLRGEAPRVKDQTQRSASLESNPTGGFIQVFSFEELSAVIKKSHGIEGFFIISNEGLVVWKDFPLRMNQDVLAARMLGHSQGIGELIEESGLTKVRRVMIESREHFIFSTTLDQNFSLILFFNGRVAPEEILSRIAVLAKTCREFLQWKYPSLPLKAGAPREAALEMA